MQGVLGLSRESLFQEKPMVKLTNVPSQFNSWPEYLNAFKNLVLENARVELLRDISDPSFIEVDQVFKNRSEKKGKKKLRLSMPSNQNQLHLGDIAFVARDDATGLKNPKADAGWILVRKVDRKVDSIVVTCLYWNLPPGMETSKSLYCSVFGTAVPTERVLDSMDRLTQAKGTSKTIIGTLLKGTPGPSQTQNPFSFESSAAFCTLNSSQKTAVKGALGRVKSGGFELIQGPPGTGKTKTTATLILGLRSNQFNKTVLTCAPTNVAMLEVAKKVIDIKPPDISDLEILIICREERATDHLKGPYMNFNIHHRIRTYGRSLLDLSKRLNQCIIDEGAHKALKPAEVKRKAVLLWKIAKDYTSLRNELADCRHCAIKEFVCLVDQIINYAATAAKFEQAVVTSNSFDFWNSNCKKVRDSITKAVSFDNSGRLWSPSALEAETLCALKDGVEAIIMVGDTRQLPATVFSKPCEAAGFKRSLFQRLESLSHPVHFLDTQYRMHPSISRYPSEIFYDGKLKDSACVMKRHHSWYASFPPVEFFSHQGSTSVIDKTGSSSNKYEARLICEHLGKFLAGKKGVTVGIICLYKAQVALLKNLLPNWITGNLRKDNTICINTVDGFQGQERNIIIVSLTKTKYASEFANDACRTNVSLTRAKDACWVFGDAVAFKDGKSHWGAFMQHVHRVGLPQTVKPVKR
ncbi:AAA domain-containing protein [Chytridium lagenaria]|nr:AAA domain-containing protein [Chytridium lagenaria]